MVLPDRGPREVPVLSGSMFGDRLAARAPYVAYSGG